MAQLERGGWRRPTDTLPAEALDRPQQCARARWERTFPAYSTPADERPGPMQDAASAAPDDGIEPDAAGLG